MNSQKVIPKIIHYCWFGGKPLPGFAKKCIKSWEKYCPDYEIKEWNESNLDMEASQFIKDAYSEKKWAFVSDYIRYQVIYKYGGIYLDTDVEVIRNFDELLNQEAFMGFENNEYVASGLGFGAKKQHPTIKKILDYYNSLNFRKNLNNLSKIATPIIVTNLLEKDGLMKNGEFQKISGVTIFPTDYFCPKNPQTRVINITKNTYSIHHYDASWVDDQEKKYIELLDKKGQEIMQKFPDLVSIIIPVYNGEQFVREAIDSALDQTYQNTEIIVVNDGSCDKTEEIVLGYGSRIRYIKQKNSGVAAALNTGIVHMRGKYFAWLSHDDVYYPDKIEQLIKHIKGCDKKVIAISDWSIIDEKSNIIKHNRIDDRLEESPRAFLAFDRKTWLNACAMLIPKNIFDEFGRFDESLRTTQDYAMFNKLIGHGVKFSILHRPLLYSRSHKKQGSLSDPTALDSSDAIHSSIIQNLSNEDVKGYFGSDFEEMLDVYGSFLNNGYKKTPAYIIKTLSDYLISIGEEEQLKIIISKTLVDGVDDISDKIEYFFNKVKKNSTGKPRILFCSAHWLTGGMERVLSNLFSYLKKDYELFLLTPYDGRESSINIPRGVIHIKISNTLFYDHFDSVALSYAFLLKINVAVGVTNLLEKQLSFYALCSGTNIKTIASTHEQYFYPHKNKNVRNLIAMRLNCFAKANVVLWLTNFSAAVYNLYNDNGYLMPNPNTFQIQKNQINTSVKNILCVGRFNDYVKRIDRVLECYKIIQQKDPEIKLILVGTYNKDDTFKPGDDMTIADLINKLGINLEGIEFVGETTNMKKYYNQASVLLLTSSSEGFPMVINEAACFGVPAVCTRISGIEDIIENGTNGYIVEQDDITAMADYVYKIITDQATRLELGINAKKLSERFDADMISKKWSFLIDQLLNQQQPSDIKKHLKKELSFSVDEKTFSKALVLEFDDILSIHQKEIEELENRITNHRNNNPTLAKFINLCRKARNYCKTNGSCRTFIKIVSRIKERLYLVR